MKTLEEMEAKRASEMQYRKDVREERRENAIERKIAREKDKIRRQLIRQGWTNRFFSNTIAKSESYNTFVKQNIARHERIISKLQYELNGELYPVDEDEI